MIKVLMVVKAMEKTGVSNVMLSYFDFIDKSQIYIDFATGLIYEKNYKKHIENAGAHFWIIPNRDKNLYTYIKKLTQLINENRYEIVHVHGNSGMIFPELIAAKLGGAKVRIAHSHNTMCNHPILEPLVRPIFEHYYTHAIACSKEAGKWMFKNKPFKVVNNGIDTSKMAFSKDCRQRIRNELGISENTVVIGHIGSFNYQKNHKRLVDIYQAILQKNNNTKLLLIGNGNTRAEIEKIVRQNNLLDHVIFYGQSDNISSLLSAMDVFVLPSHFEGFGIVLLEAQACGLNCIASSKVPQEANVADAVEYISLEETNENWANKCLKAAEKGRGLREKLSLEYRNKIVERKYDIRNVADDIRKFYIDTMQ